MCKCAERKTATNNNKDLNTRSNTLVEKKTFILKIEGKTHGQNGISAAVTRAFPIAAISAAV